MKEFYKNSKRNTLRYIVFKNKTRQLPYLRIVPKNQIKFRKSKMGNILQYNYKILPNNEYHRLYSKYTKTRYHMFSCIHTTCHIIKNLRLNTEIMLPLNEIKSDRHKKIYNLKYTANISGESK